MVREDFLQQNAFMDVDSYSDIRRQKKLMGLILHYENLCRDALEQGVEAQKLFDLPAREDLGRAKYEEADVYAAAYDKIADAMEQQVNELIGKVGEFE